MPVDPEVEAAKEHGWRETADLDYVPRPRRADYVRHLLDTVVEPGGRLVVGVFNEERDQDSVAALVASSGFPIAGRTSRPHRHPAVAYKVFWVDAR